MCVPLIFFHLFLLGCSEYAKLEYGRLAIRDKLEKGYSKITKTLN